MLLNPLLMRYPESNVFSCKPEYKGLISLIWPDAYIYEDQMPFFLPNGRIVFYSDKYLNNEDDRIIRVTKDINRVELSTKSGFVKALKYVLGNIEPWEEKALMELGAGEFWVSAKNRLVAPMNKKDFDSGYDSSVLKLFEVLFSGFCYSFPVYSTMSMPYRSIVLSLMTMMISSVNPIEKSYSSWYIGILNRNAKYIDHFKKCVLSYVESKQTEQDFLTFLYEVYPYLC